MNFYLHYICRIDSYLYRNRNICINKWRNWNQLSHSRGVEFINYCKCKRCCILNISILNTDMMMEIMGAIDRNSLSLCYACTIAIFPLQRRNITIFKMSACTNYCRDNHLSFILIYLSENFLVSLKNIYICYWTPQLFGFKKLV